MSNVEKPQKLQRKIDDYDIAVMAEIIKLLSQKSLTKEELQQIFVRK